MISLKPAWKPNIPSAPLSRYAGQLWPRVHISTADFPSLHGGDCLQAAINALPDSGGVIDIRPGIYELEHTLLLGNGTAQRWATRQGIILRSAAPPNNSPWDSSVVLRWAAESAVPMVAIMGPLVGWGLDNLHIDGAGKASAALYIQSGQMGNCHNLIIQGCRYYGIQSTTVPTIDGQNTDSLHNYWQNIRIWHLTPALQPYGAGISLDTGSSNSNTCLNSFMNTMVIVAGAPALGLRLGGCDTNFFWGFHVYATEDTLGPVGFDFANAGSSYWPCNNQFFGMTFGPHSAVPAYGTPHAETCGNIFWGWTQQGDPANPLPYAPTLATFTTNVREQDFIIVPGSNPAYARQPHGNLRLHTSTEDPHHFVGSIQEPEPPVFRGEP